MVRAAPTLRLVPDRTVTFREVYDGEFAFVWRLIRRLGVPERNAEDGAQEVFVRFHQNFEKWDQHRSVRAFLSGFAWNVASEMRKRASTRNESPAIGDMPELAHDGGARMDGGLDAARLVQAALDCLGENEREVIVLHLLEGNSMREVAEILKQNENTCSSRLRTARAKFEPRLRALMRGDS